MRLTPIDPVTAMRPFGDEPWAALLASDGSEGATRSFLLRRPDRTLTLAADDISDAQTTIRDFLASSTGMVLGLAAYELGARVEPVALPRDPDWPDLILGHYPAWLELDHAAGTVSGRGGDPEAALAWLAATADAPASPAATFEPEARPEAFEAAVADVVRRIGEGELFQANIAQAWRGELAVGATPWGAFERLAATSPAPLAAFWRLPDRALVSHSPERFLELQGRRVRTRPIKGPRPRGATPDEDAGLAAELSSSAKDRAENLMIVDLMRNDLARVCEPGSVEVTDLFAVEAFPNVWHLVSTVEGDLREGADAADLLAATFPPGSITGAPKTQAMRVISALEGPRGPWCGSLFRVDPDGSMDSSVLIRTAAFVEDAGGWRFRTLAGAGITADSEPLAERLETEAKIAGLRRALTEAP
ncbi:anthranilate synthase component I family protein [Brevundimonas sp.]|uniref:anthranilate synthase component I family protein n=1 Tax=Brevundimonas sp. TaxID=1871086 RepID=UPI0025DE2096|nr:anthranilate synthase component I family protein [Brevundimonas sp.]